MLKLNKNLNKGKTQIIGKFKLQSSLNGALENQPKWVNEADTEKTENLIGYLFTNYLREVEKRKVLYFLLNKNDDHKNPDLLINLDNKVYGVQVTQFVLREYLSRFNQAKRICEKLSGFISDIYKPPIKINIQISTPWESDEVPRPKSPTKKYKKLAKEIATKISENIEILNSKNEYLNFHLNKPEFKEVADDFSLYPVPKGNKSNFFGDNNIYIDYGFDDILIFEEDIKETVDKIYNNKNNGNSEILIIWGDERQFMNTEKHIIKALTYRFENTTFESVYFISFVNFLNIQDRVIYVNKIK
ncbi:hypothetical protein [Tenacibaculum finnmarkense]|uniref:hypothetical protein n=1 Tax=Tenacibaculum finnmarkense TaxID=2781243 RepID=UPI001E567249|nr:hypothetical protein [Tenacibaculum finnmarkense]MCD8440980.1 hypothetical protein [Tenacibaculum finnmarkense genomovar ulcerans]MCG8721906.1 hypothetical protein [Tenacibaculum finnmarkense]